MFRSRLLMETIIRHYFTLSTTFLNFFKLFYSLAYLCGFNRENILKAAQEGAQPSAPSSFVLVTHYTISHKSVNKKGGLSPRGTFCFAL